MIYLGKRGMWISLKRGRLEHMAVIGIDLGTTNSLAERQVMFDSG